MTSADTSLDDTEADLIDQLGLKVGDVVSLVGGGGKSTLMQRVYDEGRRRGWRVVGGTTTRVWVEQGDAIRGFLYSRREGDKLIGVPASIIDSHVRGELHGDLTVIEADGSAEMPVKAPAPHEPMIPSSTNVVLCVIGCDALDRVIEDQGFRPGRIAAIVGCTQYERLTPARAAGLLLSPDGGRKSLPDGARFVVVINKVRYVWKHLANELQQLLEAHRIEVVQLPWFGEEPGHRQ